MTIRYGNREEIMLLPPSIEDYISEDDPVRAYDVMIDAIDLESIGLVFDDNKVGPPPYDPRAMMKLFIYGGSYGWRSSRKLQRATHHNVSFMWLMGGLRPDHKTIANFRRNNKAAIKKVFKQIVRLCLDINLIEGNCLFVDGTKIRGAASINNTMSKTKLEKHLLEIDDKINKLLEECEQIDNEESGNYVELETELQSKTKLKAKIESSLNKMNEENLSTINTTDPDAIKFKGRQGKHTGYNGQVVTDELNGLIVSADVVNESNDLNQFSKQIDNANQNLDTPCKTAVADAGYAKVDDIITTTDKGIDVIVPSQKQAAHNPKDDPFGKDKFTYDKDKDEYICPEGKTLTYYKARSQRNHAEYKISTHKDCLNCKHFGKCTNSKIGRTITRLNNEELKEKLEARYSSDEGQAFYKKRKSKVELQFGHIKRNLNGGHFLLRGLEGVKAEFAILASCFNITRMIKLLGGVSSMVNLLKMKSVQES
jgi:transposase